MLYVTLRPIAQRDLEAVSRLIFDAVHHGTTVMYTAEQRAAWMPSVRRGGIWYRRLMQGDGWVAVKRGDIVGVITMTDCGYIDLVFVAPSMTGHGVGGMLIKHIISSARMRGLICLITDASLIAAPLFARHGWRILRRQRVRRNGTHLLNVRMGLLLRQPAYGIYRSYGSRWRCLSASFAESYVSCSTV